MFLKLTLWGYGLQSPLKASLDVHVFVSYAVYMFCKVRFYVQLVGGFCVPDVSRGQGSTCLLNIELIAINALQFVNSPTL